MESLHQCVPFVSVANTRNGFIAIFCVFEIVKVFVLEHKLSLDTVVGSAEELIENMVVPLAGVQLDHSGLFEQIPIDVRPGNLPRPRKLDANEFSESRRVIIADSLRVAERFQDWIRTQYLLGQVRSSLRLAAMVRWQNANLRHKNALVFAVIYEFPESFLSDCKDVWFCIFATAPSIHIDIVPRIDWQRAVGVDSYKEKTRIGLQIVSLVAASY